MRTPHWSTLIWAWLLVSFASWTCQAAEPGYHLSGAPSAQDGAFFSNGPTGPMMPYGVVPAAASDGHAAAMAGYGAPGGSYGPSGYPPSFNGYPGVSPYDHAYQQTRNQDGLWFEEWRDNVRQWEFGLEALAWRMRRPGYERVGFPIPLTFFMQPTTAAGGGAGTAVADPNLQNISRLQDLGGIRDDLSSLGIRPRLGFTNADESGFEMSGFLLVEHQEELTLLLGTSPAPGLARRPPGVAAQTLTLNYMEIPLVNLLTGQATTTLFFDRRGQVLYDSQAWGAEGQFFTTPLIGRSGNKVRGSYGLRYIGTREGLEIRLNDSLNGQTRVDAVVNSQLVGPEIGARWDLGGSRLRLTTYGKIGALVNTQRISLGASNYAGRDTALQEQHTKISPMIDIGLQSEFPLLQQLPLVNKVPGLRDGLFKVGYSYTAVWMMQRPASSITWADPMPVIDDDPQRWHMHGWNIGLNWNW
jgi:hypothetical protein